MKLERLTCQAIYSYPSLYYKGDWEKSQLAFYCQIFTVIGNGCAFNNKGEMTARHYDGCKFPKELIKRVKAGEPIARISELDDNLELANIIGVTGKICGENTSMFLKDFLALNKTHYIHREKVANPIKDRPVIQVYTDNKSCESHPYPFNLEYCPFWNRKTNNFIPKDMISPDYRAAIVKTFKWCLDWFQSDKWEGDNYYNYASDIYWRADKDNHFIKNWGKYGGAKEMCVQYNMPFVDYKSPQEMAKAVCHRNREEYISNCKKVIDFYS